MLITNKEQMIDEELKQLYESNISREEAFEDKAERNVSIKTILGSKTFITLIVMGMAQHFNSMFFSQTYKSFA